MTTDSAPAPSSSAPPAGASSTFAIERNGINVIDESERKGQPHDLFWPWCASNISVFGVSYGSFVLGFGIGGWQGILAAVAGVVLSFLLVGFVSLAGKRGSAPTMVLSRAPFGVRGNALPSVVSYLILVGYETALVALATFATATVFDRLGWSSGDATKVIAFVVVAAIIVGGGILGFDTVMRLQKWLTILMVIVTIGYIALTVDEISWSTVSDLPNGSSKAVFGAFVVVFSGFGISWVNSAADYSRYLPRSASSRGIVWWTTFGGSLPLVILLTYGVLLAGSDPKLSAALAVDPIGALTIVLPDWFLLPFAIVAVAGLVSGALLDIYSSGLTLLTLGLPVQRWMAAGLDGVIMVIGTIYIVWVADDFLTPFFAFLVTLAVPISAWCGIFLADLLLRKREYDATDLADPRGRYGSFNAVSVGLMVVSSVIGWGLVVSTARGYEPEACGFGWQGFLLEPLGSRPQAERAVDVRQPRSHRGAGPAVRRCTSCSAGLTSADRTTLPRRRRRWPDMESRTSTVELWDGEQAQQYADEVFAVYDEVFGDHPDMAEWRSELYDRHCGREGFRLAVAFDDDRLVGFAWGYVGRPGQYWSDWVIQTLPEEVTRAWVGGHFEVVELAVLPDDRRHGYGRRLHDVLLDGVAADRALLSTDNRDSPAVRLYTSHGWRSSASCRPTCR